MKNKFSISLIITSSKLLGYLILITGTIIAFVLKDAAVFISSAALSAGLHGLRSWSEGLTRRRELDHRRYNNYDGYDNDKPYDEIG